MTASHVFTVRFRIAGAREPDPYALRAYGDDRLADMLLGGPDRSAVFDADFERGAASFADAVSTAVRDIDAVFPEAKLLRVDPEDLVTLSEIAARVGRSHESVRLLTLGRRGPGDFPPPAGTLDTRTQVWRWNEIVAWFNDRLGEEVAGGENAAFLAAINDILALRNVVPHVIRNERAMTALTALLPSQLRARPTSGTS